MNATSEKICRAALMFCVFVPVVCAAAARGKTENRTHYGFLGTYSDLEYYDETGDLQGVEFRIVYTDDGIVAVVVEAEGKPTKPQLVKVAVEGNSIRFKYGYDPKYQTSVIGYKKNREYVLEAISSSGHKNVVHKRIPYWNNYDDPITSQTPENTFYWDHPKSNNKNSTPTTICGTYSNAPEFAARQSEWMQLFIYPDYCFYQYADNSGSVSEGEIVPVWYDRSTRRIVFVIAHGPFGVTLFEGHVCGSPSGSAITGKFNNADGYVREVTLKSARSYWDDHQP